MSWLVRVSARDNQYKNWTLGQAEVYDYVEFQSFHLSKHQLCMHLYAGSCRDVLKLRGDCPFIECVNSAATPPHATWTKLRPGLQRASYKGGGA